MLIHVCSIELTLRWAPRSYTGKVSSLGIALVAMQLLVTETEFAAKVLLFAADMDSGISSLANMPTCWRRQRANFWLRRKLSQASLRGKFCLAWALMGYSPKFEILRNFCGWLHTQIVEPNFSTTVWFRRYRNKTYIYLVKLWYCQYRSRYWQNASEYCWTIKVVNLQIDRLEAMWEVDSPQVNVLYYWPPRHFWGFQSLNLNSHVKQIVQTSSWLLTNNIWSISLLML